MKGHIHLFFRINVKQFIHHPKGKDFITIYRNKPKLPNQIHELLLEAYRLQTQGQPVEVNLH